MREKTTGTVHIVSAIRIVSGLAVGIVIRIANGIEIVIVV